MATIYDLALMSRNVYEGSLLKGLSSDNWEVLQTSATNPDGYFGVAYYNTVTHEVVIANRGTDSAQNLFVSDISLAIEKQTSVQKDAADFALGVARYLHNPGTPANPLPSIPFTSVIETGHSLGGTEAQAAIVALVNDPQQFVPAASVSGVLFNSPGIGGYTVKGNATSYNVVDIYDQGDAVHLAGGTHLGHTIGNLVMLGAGPDTSKLALLAPAAIAAGPAGILALLGTAIYDVTKAAHSIDTIVPYIASGGSGSATGAFNWTSNSNPALIPGQSGNPSLPYFGFDANGNLLLTDPVSGVTATISESSDSLNVNATFSGGSSAMAQALDSLGTVTISKTELSQSIAAVSGASLVNEFITANSDGTLGILFESVNGAPSPTNSSQFRLTVANPTKEYDYAVPAVGQTIVETITNNTGSAAGSIVVLGASATTLTGGAAAQGQNDVWSDNSQDQYSFVPSSPDSPLGTLTISKGLFGSGGDEIVINNFNLASAQGPLGFMGIFLGNTLTLNATANAGVATPAPNFIAGSNQSYTLSIDAPSTTAQTIAVTLKGAISSDFEVRVGNVVSTLNANGSFNVTLPAGETNVAFTLIDTTADNGSSDIAGGAVLQLSTSMANPIPGGAPIQSAPLTFNYIPGTVDTAAAPNPTTNISGTLLGRVTTYAGDVRNDLITAGAGPNLISAAKSLNDSIMGGIGSAIYGGSATKVITQLFRASMLRRANSRTMQRRRRLCGVAKWSAAVAFGTFFALSRAMADESSECIHQKVAFDGVTPLRYATVVGDKGSRLTLHRDYPVECANEIPGSCKGEAYLVPGDAVAIGKTCGTWAYAQYIGEKKITIGWVNAGSLVERKHEADPPRLDVWSFFHGRDRSHGSDRRYSFRLTKGHQVQVCEAYLERLNQTEFDSPPYCGRPESNLVPGFSVLNRIQLQPVETNRLYKYAYSFQFPPRIIGAFTYETGGEMDIRAGKVDMTGDVGDGLYAWRYEPQVDLNNDGSPDDVIVWHGVEDGSYVRLCGVENLIMGGGIRNEQMPMLVDPETDVVNQKSTAAIIAHPTQTYDQTLHTGNLYMTASDFRPIARAISIFKYGSLFYFDGFFDIWGDAQNHRRGQPSLANTLAVFLNKDGATRQVCEYRLSGSDYPVP